jgi:hypothetical protein
LKTPLLMALAISLLSSSPIAAANLSVDRTQVNALVSVNTGQLLDWSKTDRRIERIFIDNPEQFRQIFVFATDGCDKDKCSASASMINISARSGTTGIKRGSMKVVVRDRSARKYVYVIHLTKVTWTIRDGITSFS